MAHRFGARWTEIKLDALRGYLSFYTMALKDKPFPNNPFRLNYIDGFAGTGSVMIKSDEGDRNISGSARIALLTDPPFQRIFLIDNKPSHVKELNALCMDLGATNASVYGGDANEEIKKILKSIDWRNERAVMFLDPYGLSVEWPTVKEIARTKAVDLWYLFPLSGITRQAPRRYAAMDSDKERALTRCLGTDEWISAFYEPVPQADLFSSDEELHRTAEWDDLLTFVQERFSSTFPYVAEPLILFTTNNSPLFALFFMISNPDPKAIALSKRVAEYILNKQR